jgi:hypothetical protein
MLVADDRVPLVEERLEEPAVRVEARRVEDRVLHPEKAGDRRLEPLVRVLGAADEAHAREPVSVGVERGARRVEDTRMRAQPEVVVRAEVEDRLRRLAHADRRALRAQELPLALLEARRADVGEGRRVDLRCAFVHADRIATRPRRRAGPPRTLDSPARLPFLGAACSNESETLSTAR